MTPTPASEGASGGPRIGPLVGLCVLRFALGMPVLAALVLLPAGTLRRPAGWLLPYTFAACLALNMAVLLACNPEVVAAGTNGTEMPAPETVGWRLWPRWQRLAAAVNRFFTKELAIQAEHGHHVVDGGPYRFVRHPGYFGFSLMCVGMPLILGSGWAIIPGVLSVAGIVVRTFFEDIVLRDDLPGYREYDR